MFVSSCVLFNGFEFWRRFYWDTLCTEVTVLESSKTHQFHHASCLIVSWALFLWCGRSLAGVALHDDGCFQS